jgi:hypothetical protein
MKDTVGRFLAGDTFDWVWNSGDGSHDSNNGILISWWHARNLWSLCQDPIATNHRAGSRIGPLIYAFCCCCSPSLFLGQTDSSKRLLPTALVDILKSDNMLCRRFLVDNL